MGKEIGSFYKNNQSKLSTTTLKKPGLSYLYSHKSSASNYTQISILSRLDKKHININQNKNSISNKDDIHSYVTPRGKNYSVQATSTTTHFISLNATFPIASVKLHTTTELPRDGK